MLRIPIRGYENHGWWYADGCNIALRIPIRGYKIAHAPFAKFIWGVTNPYKGLWADQTDTLYKTILGYESL